MCGNRGTDLKADGEQDSDIHMRVLQTVSYGGAGCSAPGAGARGRGGGGGDNVERVAPANSRKVASVFSHTVQPHVLLQAEAESAPACCAPGAHSGWNAAA